MKFGEFLKQVNLYAERGEYDNNRVVISLSEPSIGGRAYAEVQGIYPGFDWERGQMRIEPGKKILSYEKDRDKEVEPIKRDWENNGRITRIFSCPKCGSKLKKSDRFCSCCGQKIKVENNKKRG